MKKVKLKLDGMHCNGCVNSVRFALEDVPGVSQVNVTLNPQIAEVEYNSEKADIPALTKAVQDAGYTVVESEH